MSQRTLFFATRSDLLPVIERFENGRDLKYVLICHSPTASVEHVVSALNVPDLGIATHGDAVLENNYLVAHRQTPIQARPIELRRGGFTYAFDQRANPQTVVVAWGGLFNKTCLIHGQISTTSNDPTSVELYQAFRRAIIGEFKKIGASYVGPEAKQLFDTGVRLTTAESSPPEYDLKPEP